VPVAPFVPEPLRSAPFRGSTAVRAGLITHRRLAGATWRRLFQDVYVHRDVPVTHALRAGAVSLLLPRAVVSGCSAAVLWGVDLAGPGDDVEVTLPPGSHMVRLLGVRARRAALLEHDVLHRLDTAVTSPEATAVRLASVLALDHAVAAVDQLVATGFVGLPAVRARAGTATGSGSARARAVCALADGLAESPQETKLRLLLHRSGLPMPVAQFRIAAPPASSPARTSRGPRRRWPSSTTGCGTPNPASSPRTDADSTGCRRRGGGWSS
jgi:hypothetical protein